MGRAGDHELDPSGSEDQGSAGSAACSDRRTEDQLLMSLALDEVPTEAVEDAKSVFRHRFNVRRVAG
jgi:hypothetical protein